MSWLYSLALEEEYLAANCLDGEPFAPSSSTPTQRVFLWRVKTTDAWTRFPSGMTCEPLTENHGEGLLTWFLAAFPVRTFPAPEKEKDSTESEADCGAKCGELLARYNPDTRSLKTLQCSLFEEGCESLRTLPEWGWMRGGELYRQPTPERLTCASASGLPPAVETGGGYFPTPCLPGNGGSHGKAKLNSLIYPTPHANCHTGPGYHGTGGATCKPLWPTPQHHNYKEPGAGHVMRGGRRSDPTIAVKHNAKQGGDQCKRIPTASANDWKGSARGGQRRGQLTDPDMGVIEAGGQLNPDWVEWLMGWPIGWTDLKPLATDKFQQWLDSHGKR